jgi:hypothetical protein
MSIYPTAYPWWDTRTSLPISSFPSIRTSTNEEGHKAFVFNFIQGVNNRRPHITWTGENQYHYTFGNRPNINFIGKKRIGRNSRNTVAPPHIKTNKNVKKIKELMKTLSNEVVKKKSEYQVKKQNINNALRVLNSINTNRLNNIMPETNQIKRNKRQIVKPTIENNFKNINLKKPIPNPSERIEKITELKKRYNTLLIKQRTFSENYKKYNPTISFYRYVRDKEARKNIKEKWDQRQRELNQAAKAAAGTPPKASKKKASKKKASAAVYEKQKKATAARIAEVEAMAETERVARAGRRARVNKIENDRRTFINRKSDLSDRINAGNRLIKKGKNLLTESQKRLLNSLTTLSKETYSISEKAAAANLLNSDELRLVLANKVFPRDSRLTAYIKLSSRKELSNNNIRTILANKKFSPHTIVAAARELSLRNALSLENIRIIMGNSTYDPSTLTKNKKINLLNSNTYSLILTKNNLRSIFRNNQLQKDTRLLALRRMIYNRILNAENENFIMGNASIGQNVYSNYFKNPKINLSRKTAASKRLLLGNFPMLTKNETIPQNVKNMLIGEYKNRLNRMVYQHKKK